MDVVVKARKGRVTPQVRSRVERKLDRLARHAPRLQRVEVEIIEEPNPRVDGGHRVEASGWTPRRSFHARAKGPSLEGVLDQVVHRLERQLDDHRGKRRAKLIDGANRVKSGLIRPEREGSGS